jgi:hypothetical protein
MTPALLWFAEGETLPLEEELKALPVDYRFLITFGALFLVSLGVFIWAAYFRKRPRRHHYHFRRRSAPPPPEGPAAGGKDRWFSSRKRHRHRHRERPLNPTLAEVGGLPPVRKKEDPRASV